MTMSKWGIPNGQSSIHKCIQNVDAAAKSIMVLVNFYNIIQNNVRQTASYQGKNSVCRHKL